MQQLRLHLLQPIAPCSLISRSCMERRGQVVQLESGFSLDSSRSNNDEQQLASSQAEMGLFPLHWGSVREGKRQKCEQLERIQSPAAVTLSIQQSGGYVPAHPAYAFVGPPPHIHAEEKENNENGTRQHQQQADLLKALGNDKLLEMLRSSLVVQDMESAAAAAAAAAHEHLFYKVVTPSDVGKLNRLVIPKQHAERYFPLDPSLRKKGRLLSFQDVVSRELWWFRYSYWSSSQSYVLTKGWIRFVKEKDLQAGDIISFERGARHELYINCRKRPTSSRGFIIPDDEVDDDGQQAAAAAAAPVATMSKLQLRCPDLGTMQLAHSSSEEDGEEEATAGAAEGTRLFGVDLRAKPIQNITRM